MTLADRLAQTARTVEACLDAVLSEAVLVHETHRPPQLLEAMRYAVLGGGKRFRPFLVMEVARLFGIDAARSVRIGAAVECVHCYSLAHDDLPAMDDDDLRRGRPSLHRAFDEATAILAGDALLTLAFDLLADPDSHADPQVRCRLVLGLARAAGLGGMVGGQVLDLQAEGQHLAEADIVRLQAMKTGALIRFSAEAGAILGGADATAMTAITRYGDTIGLAFQLSDDLLDVEASAEIMGKATGKDVARGKATQVVRHGATWARGRLEDLANEAAQCLAPFGDDAATLMAAADYVATRRS